MADNAKLTRAADNIRVLAASMVEKAKSGHPGGAMGGADFINVLYTEFLRYDPDDLRYPFRDRLFLDPGHMSPMLYSTLALAGNYTMDDLKAFRQWGSCTPGHPKWTCCAAWKIPPARWVRDTPWRWAQRSPSASWWPFRPVAGAQDLCLHLGRRRAGGDFAGRGPHRRSSGTVEPDHVLRLEQHPALDQGRRGGHRGRGRQIQGLGLERAPRRRTVGRRDPRRAPHGRCRDRASDDHHRPHGDGQRRGSRRRHVV